MHVIAGKAAAFHEALQPSFTDYSKAVATNAKALAAVLSEGGLRLVTGGTDCHLLLIDLQTTGLTGKVVVETLDRMHLTANRNPIPFDPLPPVTTSGVRLGTPAGTSRGFREAEFREIGTLILKVVNGLREGTLDEDAVRARVARLTDAFPVSQLR